MAKTKEEFESRLRPVYLDIATDALILCDPEGYLKRKFEQIKSLLEKEGLKRKKDIILGYGYGKNREVEIGNLSGNEVKRRSRKAF